MDEYLNDLASPDPNIRFRAFRMLRDNYDPRVGDALVSAFIKEQAIGVWWLAAICVLPIWLPLLDRRLSELQRWPFTGPRTLRVIKLANGRVLHSAEPHVRTWADDPLWEFRFSAFRWLTVGGTMKSAFIVATDLLAAIDSDFSVSDEAHQEGSWMEEFAQQKDRKEELRAFLEDCEG